MIITRKDEAYIANLRQQNKTVQKTSSFHSEDSAIKLDSEPRQRKAFGYDQVQYLYLYLIKGSNMIPHSLIFAYGFKGVVENGRCIPTFNTT